MAALIGQRREMASNQGDDPLPLGLPGESNDMIRMSAGHCERLVAALGKERPVALTNFQEAPGQCEFQLAVLPPGRQGGIRGDRDRAGGR